MQCSYVFLISVIGNSSLYAFVLNMKKDFISGNKDSKLYLKRSPDSTTERCYHSRTCQSMNAEP